MDKLIAALKSLLGDIDDMRCIPSDEKEDNNNWFGPFSESEDCGEDGPAIEWPNLTISAEDVKKALAEYEANPR